MFRYACLCGLIYTTRSTQPCSIETLHTSVSSAVWQTLSYTLYPSMHSILESVDVNSNIAGWRVRKPSDQLQFLMTTRQQARSRSCTWWSLSVSFFFSRSRSLSLPLLSSPHQHAQTLTHTTANTTNTTTLSCRYHRHAQLVSNASAALAAVVPHHGGPVPAGTLSLARNMSALYAEMITLLLETTTTPGELGMIGSHEG